MKIISCHTTIFTGKWFCRATCYHTTSPLTASHIFNHWKCPNYVLLYFSAAKNTLMYKDDFGKRRFDIQRCCNNLSWKPIRGEAAKPQISLMASWGKWNRVGVRRSRMREITPLRLRLCFLQNNTPSGVSFILARLLSACLCSPIMNCTPTPHLTFPPQLRHVWRANHFHNEHFFFPPSCCNAFWDSQCDD